VETVDEPVVSLIMQRTQGNPFLSRELAYALRDNGILAVREGKCSLNATYDTPESLSMLDVPETVQGIIISRIDRLSQRQQLTLKVASVIGERFSFAMLYDLYPIEQDKPHLANDLRLFEQLDLIVQHTPDPNLIYTFSHAITQSVIYNTMLFSQRRELHRAVAEWYQQTYVHNLAPYLSRIEYHLQRAQDTTTKALEPLEEKNP
jgi:predicted ATPase